MSDARLVPAALCAWLAAGLAIGFDGIPVFVVVAAWVLALVSLVVAGARRSSLGAIAALSLAAVALLVSLVAVAAPARSPAQLEAAASSHRPVALTLEVTGAADAEGRYPATIRAVGPGGTGAGHHPAEYRVAVPAFVFGDEKDKGDQPAGLGSLVRVRATVERTEPGDDSAFLVFAHERAEDVAAPPGQLEWANALRTRFADAARALPGDGGALLPGLALGDTSAVSEGLDAAMKASSLSHLTAVSGANCAIVVGLVMLVGAALGVRRGIRVGISLVVLAAFVVLVTAEPSVLRAAVMAALVLLAMLAGRPLRGIPVLAVAVIVLLCTDPWLARDYGFTLSVLATGALLALAGPLARRLARWLPVPLATVIAVPLSAQLACQPVLVLLNPVIPLHGVVANVLAEPAAPIATVVGLLACLALPAWPWLGELLTRVAWLPAGWIAGTARLFSDLPGASLPWPSGVVGLVLLSVVTALGLCAALAPRGPLRRVTATGLAVLLVACAGASLGTRIARDASRPADWVFAACDIGQGDAVVVRSAGKVALVDTGPDPEPLAACLTDLGVGRIDLLVLTHYDLDHVGAVAAVVGRVDTALVGPTGDAADERLLAGLADGGAEVAYGVRGDAGRLGHLDWRLLWPRERPPASMTTGNDASLAMTFLPGAGCTAGCLSALFLGDLGADSQSLVLASGDIPRVDVVKVAHHGSADQSERLYASTGARLGLISVGADNDYGHPTPSLLAILAANGITAARTDREGLVLVAPGDDGALTVWSERGGG